MRQLQPCTTCQRPHRSDEAACPFCGAKAVKRPGPMWVRQLKVGGLLAFTAVATAACYGAPMPPDYRPGPGAVAVASAEPPAKKVPKAVGTAFFYLTPKGAKESARTVQLEAASLSGGVLTLAAKSGQDRLTLRVKPKDAKAFEPSGQVYAAIDVAAVEDFRLGWGKAGSKDPLEGGDAALGTGAIKGTLQLDKADDKGVSGTLLVEVDGTTIALYFNAAR